MAGINQYATPNGDRADREFKAVPPTFPVGISMKRLRQKASLRGGRCHGVSRDGGSSIVPSTLHTVMIDTSNLYFEPLQIFLLSLYIKKDALMDIPLMVIV